MVITKELNGVDVTKRDSQLMIIEGNRESFEVCSSHRIGVKWDLPQELRFYIKGNKFVS
jgi:3-methyladenine DNA glycosylase Mpg